MRCMKIILLGVEALINCTKLCKCSLGSLEVHFSVRNEGLAVITRGCCDRCMVSYESTCGNAIDNACKFVRSPQL